MVKIVLTAFGKFHGVENNPTKDILKYIQSIKNFKQSIYKNICYTALIEVSAKGVSEHLLRIRDSIRNKYPTEKITQSIPGPGPRCYACASLKGTVMPFAKGPTFVAGHAAVK